jgi:photosystem II stability/assembly factor-like uncharacterized protein
MSPKINRILIPFIFLILLSLGKNSVTTGQAPAYSAYLPFISLNPTGWIGPYGGTIVAVAVDPSNPQVIYVGSFGSGVFKTTDGGNTWYSVNGGLSNFNIYSLAIDPIKTDTLYAGTYEGQVYKSQDGGNGWTWSGKGIQDRAIVYSIAIDPITPSRLYAATRGVSTNGQAPWNGVVYKSIDAGQTWTSSLSNVGGTGMMDWVYSLAINPNAPNQVFAAAHENGPYRSEDYGSTWQPIHYGIYDLSGRAIIISPQPEYSSVLYHGVWHFDSVYKSINSGDVWTHANDEHPNMAVYSMAIDPHSADSVFLATFSDGVMRTSDGGNNWQNAGLQTDLLYSIVINPGLTSNLFVGTLGDGLYRSMDTSNSWQRNNNGINNAMTTAIVLSPTDPKTLYTSLYGAGVFHSSNRGQTWDEINNGLGDKFVHDLVMDPTHPGVLYALTDTGGLFRNDLNGGNIWVSIGGGLPLTQNPMPAFSADNPFATLDMKEAFATTQEIRPPNQTTHVNLLTMAYAPSNPQIAYIGTHGSGVYRSTDGGLDWQGTALGGTILSLAVDLIDPNLVYATTEYSGSLKYSTDSGITWADALLPVYFYSLATSPTEPGVVYAGTSSGIYRRQSGNWSAVGLSNQSITAIALDPVRPGVIIAGTTSGAYYSTDNGLSWNIVNKMLNLHAIQSISFDRTIPNVVYLTTPTHGIFVAVIQF